jgi:hypothetical protein
MRKKTFTASLALCLAALSLLTACGGGGSDSEPAAGSTAAAPSTDIGALRLEGTSDVDEDYKKAALLHPDVQAYIGQKTTAGSDADTDEGIAVTQSAASSIQVTETPLPHTTQAPTFRGERLLLRAYLDRPKDALLSSFLGLVYLDVSLSDAVKGTHRGAAFKHTLMANYFLNRAKELGRRDAWLRAAIASTQKRIDKVVSKGDRITSEEDHPAHVFFNQTFNDREGDRYIALEKLLDDFVDGPKNVYTSFAIDAINLWIGGEAGHDDPTVLTNFVVGSYLSVHTMKLAEQLEVDWTADPTATPRFRMASILGGFSALQRRWLAVLHDQPDAVAKIDEEHRQWRRVQRAFHAFTVGLAHFEEPANFQEGLAAWVDGFNHCTELNFTLRTCIDAPRFSFNFEAFVLGYVDYLLKANQVVAAKQLLSIRHVPEQFPLMANYGDWDFGRTAWEYRESHADDIAAAYANGDPADDMKNFMLQKKRWSTSTSVCQTCHQAQSKAWTEEEKKVVLLPPESVASVRTWPVVSTTWYGTSLPRPPG